MTTDNNWSVYEQTEFSDIHSEECDVRWARDCHASRMNNLRKAGRSYELVEENGLETTILLHSEAKALWVFDGKGAAVRTLLMKSG